MYQLAYHCTNKFNSFTTNSSFGWACNRPGWTWLGDRFFLEQAHNTKSPGKWEELKKEHGCKV